MLNNVSDIEIAAEACTPFGEGACLPSVAVQTTQPHQRSAEFARPRPRAFWAVGAFGRRHTASDLGMALGQPNPGKHNYPYPTRIAAASGGAKGPHPARDPV
jgi:hypothetical protein